MLLDTNLVKIGPDPKHYSELLIGSLKVAGCMKWRHNCTAWRKSGQNRGKLDKHWPE